MTNENCLALFSILERSNKNLSNAIIELEEEYIKLKAIEQAAIDFVNQIVYSSEPNSKAAKDLEYLKELLQID